MFDKHYRINIYKGFAFVYAIDYHDPLEQIDLIVDDLKEIQFRGKVVFDMLLNEGSLKISRFFSNNFDGSFFGGEFEIIKNHDLDLIAKSNSFYKKHFHFIKQSNILSEQLKSMLQFEYEIKY